MQRQKRLVDAMCLIIETLFIIVHSIKYAHTHFACAHRAILLKTPCLMHSSKHKHAARPFSGESQFRDAKSAKRNSINENTHVYCPRIVASQPQQLSNDMN